MAYEWTPDRVSLLKKLWKEGVPTSEIGRQLGITKNAAVGKAHRLGLQKRQSPIARKKVEEKPKQVTLADLRLGMCAWPIGDPGDEDFHFCAKDVLPGKPYCIEHCLVAYVKNPKDSKESAKAREKAEAAKRKKDAEDVPDEAEDIDVEDVEDVDADDDVAPIADVDDIEDEDEPVVKTPAKSDDSTD